VAKTKVRRRLAASAIGVAGVIHLMLVPHYVEEEPYIGALFILGGIAAAYVGFRLWQQHDRPTWRAGAIVAAGMAAGFIFSRTTGLPGFKEPQVGVTGFVATTAEISYLGLWILPRPSTAPERGDR
jgi:uncharacterized membrane protein YfcA